MHAASIHFAGPTHSSPLERPGIGTLRRCECLYTMFDLPLFNPLNSCVFVLIFCAQQTHWSGTRRREVPRRILRPSQARESFVLQILGCFVVRPNGAAQRPVQATISPKKGLQIIESASIAKNGSNSFFDNRLVFEKSCTDSLCGGVVVAPERGPGTKRTLYKGYTMGISPRRCTTGRP